MIEIQVSDRSLNLGFFLFLTLYVKRKKKKTIHGPNDR